MQGTKHNELQNICLFNTFIIDRAAPKNIVLFIYLKILDSWMSMKQENMVGNFNYLIGHQASQIVKEQAPHAKIQMKHQDIG